VRAGDVDGTGAGSVGAAVAAAACLTPPWCEHAPRPAGLVVPSVHVTWAAVFSALGAFGSALAVALVAAFFCSLAAFFALAVALVSTPP